MLGLRQQWKMKQLGQQWQGQFFSAPAKNSWTQYQSDEAGALVVAKMGQPTNSAMLCPEKRWILLEGELEV